MSKKIKSFPFLKLKNFIENKGKKKKLKDYKEILIITI